MRDLILNSDVLSDHPDYMSSKDYTPDRRNIMLAVAGAGGGPILAKALLRICDDLHAKSKRSFIEGKDGVLWANALNTLVEIKDMDPADHDRLKDAILGYEASWQTGVPPKFIKKTVSDTLNRLSQPAEVPHDAHVHTRNAVLKPSF